jgi:hypothetical protein
MKTLLRYFTFALVVLSSVIGNAGIAMAYTNFQQNAVLEGRPLYDPNECDPNADTGSDTPANVKTGTYVAAGNIPIEGMQVGATTYGGGYDAKYGKQYDPAHPGWYPSNNQQKGVTPYDDNGMGYDGKPLPGRTAFAELNSGTALGSLPAGTKIEIDYNGTKIVAEKDDIGTGGPNIDGKPRAVDLWWESARLLDFKIGSAVVTIHAVSATTPLTPIGGSATTVTPTNAETTTSCCATLDEATGALSGSDNQEKTFNFLTGKGLTGAQAAGVIGNLMQESSLDPHAVQAGGPGRGIVQWSVGDRWDKLLAYASGQGRDPFSLELQLDFMWKELNTGFKASTLTPLKAATTVQQATVIVQDHYEICGDCQTANRLKFANAAYNLYNKGAPTDPGGTVTDSNQGCATMANGVVAGSVVKTAIGLAWPNPFYKNPDHSPDEPTPAYKVAWDGASDYTDCGAFVATVMRKSGADPNYPVVGTGIQKAYVESHLDKYLIIHNPSSTSQLRPGDILVYDDPATGQGHTEFFLGPQKGGFIGAAASFHDHTPQLVLPGSITYMFDMPGIIVARHK